MTPAPLPAMFQIIQIAGVNSEPTGLAWSAQRAKWVEQPEATTFPCRQAAEAHASEWNLRRGGKSRPATDYRVCDVEF